MDYEWGTETSILRILRTLSSRQDSLALDMASPILMSLELGLYLYRILPVMLRMALVKAYAPLLWKPGSRVPTRALRASPAGYRSPIPAYTLLGYPRAPVTYRPRRADGREKRVL